MKRSTEKPVPQPPYVSPEEGERAFYTAFAQCDLQAMGEVWAEQDVICIHPGSTVLQGREAVMQSWAEIFGGASQPSVRVRPVSKVLHGSLAVHVVEEHITPGGRPHAKASIVLATNIFLLRQGAWQMVEHHASLPMVDMEADHREGALH